MKLYRHIVWLGLVCVLLSACSKVTQEAGDVIKEVGELKESVVETSEGMVDGAKKAVKDAKEALENTKETVDGMVDGVSDGLEKVKNIVPVIDLDGDSDEETTTGGTEVEASETEAKEDESDVSSPEAYEYESGTLKWQSKKVGGMHEGLIDLASAELLVEGDAVVGGSFVVDMDTINVTDLSGGSKEGLEGKLKQEGYFDVANHPKSTFVITDVQAAQVTGDMTIKGITHEINFPAEMMVKDDMVTFKAEFNIDRTKWDIATGNLVIKKEIYYWMDMVFTR